MITCLACIKFSFSEKATKICTIFLMVLTFTKYVYKVNVKTIRKIAQIFVAFSEKLNFIGLNALQIMRILDSVQLLNFNCFRFKDPMVLNKTLKEVVSLSWKKCVETSPKKSAALSMKKSVMLFLKKFVMTMCLITSLEIKQSRDFKNYIVFVFLN